MSQQEEQQGSQELLDEKEKVDESSRAKRKYFRMDESEDDKEVSDCTCGGCQNCNVRYYKREEEEARKEEEEARKKEEKDPLEKEKDCPSNCGNCPICLESVGTFFLERANDFKKKIDLKESGKLTCAESEKFCVESNLDFETKSDCHDGECRECNTCLEKEHEQLLKKEKENLLKEQEEEENLSPGERNLNILLSIAKSMSPTPN